MPTQDPYPEYATAKDADRSKWGKRPDGSEKGDGWLGVRKRPDGSVSSEISVGVEIGGKEQEIPLMVPGLTRDEMKFLMTTRPDDVAKKLPRSILDKAVNHAGQRIKSGKSPFRGKGEPSL